MQKIEDIAGGEVVQYHDGQFLRVEKTLHQLHAPNIESFLRENENFLTKDSLVNQFPRLKNIIKSKIVFLDIETAGFYPNNQIISASLGKMNGDIRFECIFARDPGEEELILSYIIEELGKYEAVFTYNGEAFDIFRLARRIESKGLLPKNGFHKNFKQVLAPKHCDLYQEARKKMHLPDNRLQTIEKLIVGHSREHEISGRQIGRVYNEYVNGADNLADIKKIIYHNLIDAAATIAVPAYLASLRK